METEEQGLSLIYPAGYLELKAQQEKEKKRKSGEKGEDDEEVEEEEGATSVPAKKAVFSIISEWKEKFKLDEQNVKIWSDVEAKEMANKKELTDYIEEHSQCLICQVG